MSKFDPTHRWNGIELVPVKTLSKPGGTYLYGNRVFMDKDGNYFAPRSDLVEEIEKPSPFPVPGEVYVYARRPETRYVTSFAGDGEMVQLVDLHNIECNRVTKDEWNAGVYRMYNKALNSDGTPYVKDVDE